MSATDTVTSSREITRRFVDAFNTRDAEALRDIVADDVELRTLSGGSLRGHDGLRKVLEVAEARKLLLVPFRTPTVETDDGTVRVHVPVKELIGPDDIERTAEFEIRDGRIVAFAVRPFE
jgi:ketosteroid isomerase-like protein